jgi:hypothetical protein
MSDGLLADCGGPDEIRDEHTTTCWEDEPTSPAETAIIRYLAARLQLLAGSRLLHVGVGNSALPLAFGGLLAEYVGLTISRPEIDRFEELVGRGSNATTLFANKYDVSMLAQIDGDFDLIIDTLLKSMTCCEKHFLEMMVFFARRLRPGGMLLTTRNGVCFGWPGNTKMAHTPGAQTDPAIAQFRVLGVEQLEILGATLGLSFEAVNAAPGQAAGPDQVLILKKLHL